MAEELTARQRASRKYYRAHKDELNAKKKAEREAHKEYYAKKAALYYLDHRLEICKRNRKYYLDHIDERRAYQLAYYQAHKDDINAKKRVKRAEYAQKKAERGQ